MTKEEKFKEITLVYVEDDDFIREGIAKYLRRRCKKLVEAADGKEGLEAYKANLPEMIITDIEMPVMNGIEMIEKILDLNGDQPIIITTGYDDDEHKSDRVCKNILKPINLAGLLEAIDDCLGLTDD